MQGQLNLFPPAYFHLVPALPLLVVHRTVATGIPSCTSAKSHSGSPHKLNKKLIEFGDSFFVFTTGKKLCFSLTENAGKIS